jgi:hypothetical protein
MESINYNIPLQPKVLDKKITFAGFTFLWNKINAFFIGWDTGFLIFFFILNVLLTVIKFNYINFSLSFLYAIFFGMKLLTKFKKPRAYGIVFNSQNNRPVTFASVKLFKESQELWDTKITDKEGRFQFFAPAGNYLLLISASGYKFPSAKINPENLDYHKSLMKIYSEQGVINIDIPIDPSRAQQQKIQSADYKESQTSPFGVPL